MKIVVDVSHSPKWIALLRAAGFDAVHWSTIGDRAAPDKDIFQWAAINNAAIFTNDLDFGEIIARSGLNGPSVILTRAADVTPAHMGETVVQAMSDYEAVLERGAIMVLDETKMRLRVLPLNR